MLQRSEVAAVEVAAQIEAHVRIGIGTEIVVVVVNRGALRRRTRLSFRAADRLVVLRGMLGRLDALRVPVCAKAGEAITAASAAMASSVFMFLFSGVLRNGPQSPPRIWRRSGGTCNAQCFERRVTWRT